MNTITPEQKAKELLSEFSKEKAFDICNTMMDYAIEFNYSEWIKFWKDVKKYLK